MLFPGRAHPRADLYSLMGVSVLLTSLQCLGHLAHLVVFAIHLVHRDVALAIDLLSRGLPPLTLALGVEMGDRGLRS